MQAGQSSRVINSPDVTSGMSLDGMQQPQPQAPMPLPSAPPQEQKQDIRAFLEAKNIAEKLKEDKLEEIGMRCRQGFEDDLQSRKDWDDSMADWIKLATQVREEKSFPWPHASNIKYPLMGIAAMQFSARAYPTLVPADGRIVKSRVMGKDPTGEKNQKGRRIAEYMSWQLSYQMEEWEEEMDQLLMSLPITGNAYKKTFYDPTVERPRSIVIPVERLIVNYWAKTLETAERISEIIYLYPREVKNRQRAGFFLDDVDLSPPQGPDPKENDNSGMPFSGDQKKVVPYEIIEQHCYLDLDEDEYEEPYIVTFERRSGKVLRITARFDSSDIREDDKEKVVFIKPLQYYTKFGFIPSPDGSFYDLGFGHLLGPLNESINTIVNQLVDAGTINNLQGGFIGKGLRVRGGDYKFSPGEWKWVNATVDDLKKQILPLPTKEPSQTLMKLLEFLVTAGKELASVAEIFVGKMPGQNTPATTTMASIEQGMKVFTAIYKRVYRSLDKEFKKLFSLNKTYLDPQTYVAVLDDVSINPEDFDNSLYDICPSADPTATSQSERLMKSQALLEMLPMGVLDPIKVTMRVLDAQEQPNWQELIPGLAETGQAQIPQKQDPKLMEMQFKSQIEQQKAQIQAAQAEHKAQLEQRSQEFKLQMEAALNAQEMRHKEEMAKLDANIKLHSQAIFAAEAQQKMNQQAMGGAQEIVHKEQQHQQGMKQGQEAHTSKLKQSEEIAKSKAKLQSKTSQTGSKAKSRNTSSRK